MRKLTPDKRLDHTTPPDNAMQRYLLKPWKIYNYINAVRRLLRDLAVHCPARVPTITARQIKQAGQQSLLCI